MSTGTPEDRLPSTDRRHLLAAALGALVLAAYAAWLLADLVPRWVVGPLVAVGAGLRLAAKSSRRDQAAAVCFALAAMIAVTPIAMVLPNALAAGTYGASPIALTLHVGTLILLFPFLFVAVVIGYVGLRLGGAPGLIARLRGIRS